MSSAKWLLQNQRIISNSSEKIWGLQKEPQILNFSVTFSNTFPQSCRIPPAADLSLLKKTAVFKEKKGGGDASLKEADRRFIAAIIVAAEAV